MEFQKLVKIALIVVAAGFASACSFTMEDQARHDEVRAYWEANNGKAGKGFSGGSSVAR